MRANTGLIREPECHLIEVGPELAVLLVRSEPDLSEIGSADSAIWNVGLYAGGWLLATDGEFAGWPVG
jgi:hypothetical protein